MPELPEVETVVRAMRERLTGQRLGRVLLVSARINDENPRDWSTAIRGRTMERFERRGKYIIVYLSGGHALVIHLRMTGRIWIKHAGYKARAHDRLIVALPPRKRLVLNDTRTFARFHWQPPGSLWDHAGLAKLGPDALTITPAAFAACCRSARRPIKSLLLDQTKLAGLGNIYADESLFRAGIRPVALAGTLSPKRIERLHTSVRTILDEAIRLCGTTFDTFSDLDGSGGGFGPRLAVYQRTGEPCRRCHARIRRIVLSGRGTHYCPRCQR